MTSDAATRVLVDRDAELADQLERAIRWAVHLENRIARAEELVNGATVLPFGSRALILAALRGDPR